MPAQPMPWLHFPQNADPELALAMSEAILDRRPDISILLTGVDVPEFHEDQQVTMIPSFRGDPDEAEALIGAHAPTALASMDPQALNTLFAIVHRARLAVYMVDCGHMLDAHKGWSLLSRVVSTRFRHVSKIFVGDSPTRAALQRAGARGSQIEQIGILEVDATTLPCALDEFDALSQILAARPIWLAAKINFDELDPILAAHKQALRRAHRLVLLLVPGDPDDGDQFAEQIRLAGMEFRQRSRGEDPDPDCQVYLADEPGELGLWYRLAPITFIGHTLAGRFGNGPDPLGAAALGSAIVHGPMVEHHASSFSRLARARATYPVAHTGELAYALETFLAPDRAAQMANAAWDVSTSGSDVMQRVVDLLIEAE